MTQGEHDPEWEREEHLREYAVERARKSDIYNWRPSLFEGMFSQYAFMEGKVTPLNIAQVAWTSLPWFSAAFAKKVPENYVAVDLNDDGYSAATVACPCGTPHEVEIGTIVQGGCGRFFAWFGKEVLVARPDIEADPPD